MPSSVYQIKLNTTLGIDWSQVFESTVNTQSGVNNILTALAIGNNTINFLGTDIGVLLLPPEGNTTVITLKGNASDVGVAIHKTNPTFVGRDATQPNIILAVANQVNGFRYIRI